jgi:hypothetical protein
MADQYYWADLGSGSLLVQGLLIGLGFYGFNSNSYCQVITYNRCIFTHAKVGAAYRCGGLKASSSGIVVKRMWANGIGLCL